MAESENEINSLNSFLGRVSKMVVFMKESASVFKDKIDCDAKLNPACGGPSTLSHKALLASKSPIFKHALESDDVKEQDDTLTLPELNAEELELLCHFLYMGSLPEKGMFEKHALPLFSAAHKYDITFLEDVSETYLAASLCDDNVFDMLQIAETCLNTALKEAALNYILKHMKNLGFSEKYEALMSKNPALFMEVNRAFILKMDN